MNHPYELLADLVDGTLDETTLAGVRAHLDSCAECREDVALATRGRDAARALPEVPAPTDLHDRVVSEAGGGGRGVPLWYRWAGAAAAAAAVIVLAIALPNVGGDEDRAGPNTLTSSEATGAAAEDAVGGGSQVVVEQLSTDFDEDTLRDLAKDSAAAFQRSTGQPPQAATLFSDAEVIECVTDAWGGKISGELIRLIQARFQGREAYFAVYLEGPGANEPADTAFVYVASRSGCQALSTAFAHR